MKHVQLLFVIILFAVFNTSAASRVDKRVLSPFEYISLRISADMQVEQGEKHYIEVSASQTTIDKIIIEVINHKLIIRFSWEDMLFRNFNPGPVHIKVVSPRIEELSLQGSGNIFSDSDIETPRMELNVAGSGDIQLANLNCELLEVNISGSGDVVLSNKKQTRETKENIAGSGDLKAYQFKTEAAFIRIAGSGNCDLYVTDYLNARILGSGSLAYKGEPQIDSNISGSGSIYHK